jgi:methanogenic corrinoid protein MtbC1
MTSAARQKKGHPIQVVAKRTGLTADVLRIWERRYQAVEPTRLPNGRRTYSDADVERLRLLRLATLGGRSISQVAGLEPEELRRLVLEDERAAVRVPQVAGGSLPAHAPKEAHYERCLEAVRTLNAQRFQQALEEAGLDLPPSTLVRDLLVPLMQKIGTLWENGEIRVAHEHLASAVVRSYLGASGLRSTQNERDPALLCGTLSGQLHELGALMALIVGAEAGWRGIYLGPNLPPAEFISAARRTGARVVALSLVYPVDDPALVTQLRELRRLGGKNLEIVVGGRAAERIRPVLQEIGAHAPDSLPGLQSLLGELRAGTDTERTTRRSRN